MNSVCSCQFKINGSITQGKIVRKSPKGSEASPFWVVVPAGKRKHEEVPEKSIERLIQNETAPKSKRSLARLSSSGTASSHSDDSHDDAPASTAKRVTRGSVTGTGSGGSSSESSKKRKSDESNSATNIDNHKSRKVTIQNGKRSASAVAAKKKVVKRKAANRAGNIINTRSTRANGGDTLLPELPPTTKPSKPIQATTIPKEKNENVEVIKMLTGTLYLYRGETRRAEFIRSK